MTAAEIAKIVGVSRSTVTSVVNNYKYTSEETRKKVLEAIEKYGYEPNISGRSLAGKKNKIIGLFIYTTDEIVTSIYYSNLITNIIGVAQKSNYSVLTTILSFGEGQKIEKLLNNESICGAIITGGKIDEKINIKNNHKVVLIDQINYEKEIDSNVSIVNRDNFNGAYEATKYLINKENTNIVHITGHLFRVSAIDRMNGYKQAMIDNNIEIKNTNILEGDFSDTKAEILMDVYLNKNKCPQGIFACNDLSAIGAIRSLKKRGYKIPEEVSIIGFDNTFISKEITPSLSTVKCEGEEVAQNAIKSLISLIEGVDGTKIKKLIKTELIIRNSSL